MRIPTIGQQVEEILSGISNAILTTNGAQAPNGYNIGNNDRFVITYKAYRPAFGKTTSAYFAPSRCIPMEQCRICQASPETCPMEPFACFAQACGVGS
jgi:hypothetical protein